MSDNDDEVQKLAALLAETSDKNPDAPESKAAELLDTGTKADPEPIIRFTYEEDRKRALDLSEREHERLLADTELHRHEVARNEERYQEARKQIKAEREEWRRHVSHVERTNELLIDTLKRIALAIEDRK